MNSRFQLPLAIIVSFFGAIFYLVKNYEYKAFIFVTSTYVFLLALTSGAVVVATYFFKQAARNNEYQFMPADDVKEPHRLKLQKHYVLHSRPDGQSIDDFQVYLTGKR